ncbi:molybdopterin-binding protein [Cycloclasticus sp.]|uniref:competence/damage-inducible protein A n=1 Tax=Cycloclasticus sp. TaxID=2024830 RepID=UPI000C0D9B39|nr:molybdopterin-binding protein [Cycloclasticus sp.]PHR51897.1 MAG: competence/damage-inducible protein A [Cycloclasticus sp.]
MHKTDKAPSVIIFSQGDEVITGALVDTNAAFLADQCRLLGFDVIRHITVSDDLADLVQVLKEVDAMADVCLCTGGLGPTQDDLTAEAFAQAFQVELEMDSEALVMIAEFFAQLKIPMADVNKKQALLPTNSTRIDNRWGTAPGFSAVGQQCRFYFMPGVPYEMKQMMETFVLADLQRQFKLEQPRLITFRSMGMGESDIQQAVNSLEIDNDIRVSFRAGMPENELKLLFPQSHTKEQVQYWVDNVSDALGASLFAIDGWGQSVSNLPDCVDQLMTEKKLTLSLIETLSQGDIARQCQADWLLTSAVYPKVSGIQTAFSTVQQPIGEALALEIAKENRARHKTALSLVQLHKKVNDTTVAVFTTVADAHGHISSTKEVWGRALRQQTVASALAFNLIRKFIQNQ